jgi:hypothetical protein
MKRDMDLIRLILLNLEDEGDIDLTQYSDTQLNYHYRLLIQANLAEGNITLYAGSDGGPDISADVWLLTWEGHDFLDAIRSETIWRKVKERISPIGSVAFSVVKNLATAVALKELGIS